MDKKEFIENICQGCGVRLQTQNTEEKGYINADFLERNYCQRCFKIKQYSDFKVVDISNDALYTLFSEYIAQKLPIIHVIDITDLFGSALFELKELLKKEPVIIVVNKIDVIKREMRRYDIWEQYIHEIFKHAGIKVEALFFVSSKDILGIRRVIDYLEIHHEGKDIKIIGSANVGKSSFVQACISEGIVHADTISQGPLVFSQPGTTLDELRIPCEKFTLYDTPGVMQPTQLTYHVAPKMTKMITFQKPIRVRNYPFYEPQIYFIGAYAAIEVSASKPNSIAFYFNQMLPIHRRKPDDYETFLETHRGELLAPPFAAEFAEHTDLLDWTTTTFEITRDKTDIVISGLGWCSIKHKNCTVKVHTVSGVTVYDKNALV